MNTLAQSKNLRDTIAIFFWKRLSRKLTTEKVEEAAFDSKQQIDKQPTIYLPHLTPREQLDYYAQDKCINVSKLPDASDFDDDFFYQISREPGILGLEFCPDGLPLEYIVPGGRFNEFYGWDSYFIALGLLQDNHVDAASNIASHFAFEIKNYGKILNANRPYFLGRTQPPFLTDIAWRLHGHCSHESFVGWMKAAIIEYETVWINEPRIDRSTGLSKYNAQGRGIPPEVEKGHFDSVIQPFADRLELDLNEFIKKYNAKELEVPELDEYLLHDRSLRESGHDVTSRFVGCCADLVTIDLASLLYKYEVDIAQAVETYPSDFTEETKEKWLNRSAIRKAAAEQYLWDEDKGVFGDFNLKTRKLNTNLGISATAMWSLWSGLASHDQAQSLVQNALPQLEFEGGLAATSKVADNGRQWDYPAGWAPHQILAWEGLERYGYKDEAKRLSLKWINTIVKAANKTDGSIFEKYDVTGVENPHEVRAEYGNQGSNETGFGWSNASFVIGWDRYM